MEPIEMDWRALTQSAIRAVDTPCYLFAAGAVRAALDELHACAPGLVLRHWLSVKTQPLKPLLQLWREWGRGVEVVSEYELLAALDVGFRGHDILVNGVAKHRWLSRHPIPGLNVHFDSIAEVLALAKTARSAEWHVGLRCLVPNQHNPECPAECDQFGMSCEEVVLAADELRRANVAAAGVHFHIGTDVASADEYETALRYVAKVCCAAHVEPSYVDVGGGLPVPRADAAFDLGRFVAILAETAVILPTVREVWLENGRFMTARAGALAVRVLDRKQRGDRTYLICDGGRINHARMAALRQHDILLDPPRDGPTCWTTVCGPTSAGVDRLGTWQLPAALQPGDVIVWLNAGAYHIPLETRFSVGVAPVVWFGERGDASVVRRRETAREWWGMWA